MISSFAFNLQQHIIIADILSIHNRKYALCAGYSNSKLMASQSTKTQDNPVYFAKTAK